MKTKKCSGCNESKPTNEFNSQGKYCLECHRKKGAEWRKKNREKNKKSQKKWLKKRIITEEGRKHHNEYAKKHYHKNKKRYIERNIKRLTRIRKENALWLIKYFEEHHCVDCDEDNPLCLTFDHVRGEKKFNISKAFSTCVRTEIVMEEIKKCEVRCANCHFKKTSEEGNFTLYKMLKEINSPFVL